MIENYIIIILLVINIYIIYKLHFKTTEHATNTEPEATGTEGKQEGEEEQQDEEEQEEEQQDEEQDEEKQEEEQQKDDEEENVVNEKKYTDDNKVLLSDMDIGAVKNMVDVVNNLQKNGVTIPGDVYIKGKFNIIPKGMIIAWTPPKNTKKSFTEEELKELIPYEWSICNGENGTPDLRGRFVRMASDNLDKEKTNWGNNKVNHIKTKTNDDKLNKFIGTSRSDHKSHIFKMRAGSRGGTDKNSLHQDEMPKHKHDFKVDDHNNVIKDNAKHFKLMRSDAYASNIEKDNNGACTADYGGSDHSKKFHEFVNGHTHRHTVGHDEIGENWHLNTSPPYYVLCYIMKN